MGSDIWGKVLFSAAAAHCRWASGSSCCKDLSAKPCPWRRRVVGARVALFLVTAGMTLTLSPYTASTGAECTTCRRPRTCWGPDGAHARIDEAPDEPDRASTESCVDRARARTAGAVALVLLGSVGYAIVRRPIVRERLSVAVDASGR